MPPQRTEFETTPISRFDSHLHFYKLTLAPNGVLKTKIRLSSWLLFFLLFAIGLVSLSVPLWPLQLTWFPQTVFATLGLIILGTNLYGIYHTIHPVAIDPVYGFCLRGFGLKPDQVYQGSQRLAIPLTDIEGFQVLVKRRDKRGHRFGTEINAIQKDGQRKNLLVCASLSSALELTKQIAAFANKPIIASPALPPESLNTSPAYRSRS